MSGNRAVARVLRSEARTPPMVQTKLVVGAADDPLEREADRIADQIVRRWPSSSQSGRRAHGEDVVRRLAHARPDSAAAFEADPSMVRRLSARGGGGQALPAQVRRRMEAGFGTDFGGVRIHRDGDAGQLNADLSARAFTHGTDIYFSRGAYDPSSSSGRHLLAHELTHVVQQATRRSPARHAIGAQRLLDGALVQRTNGKGKKKLSGNRRAREAQEELSKLKTLPQQKKGSKKKSQQQKHEAEYEKKLTKFSNQMLDFSEGSVLAGGHSKGRHRNLGDAKLLARHIPLASEFLSADDQIRAVAAVFKEEASRIRDWLESDDDRLVLTIDRPADVQVRGFERLPGIGPSHRLVSGEELVYVVAVLQRDSVETANPWGLVTCYPGRNPGR